MAVARSAAEPPRSATDAATSARGQQLMRKDGLARTLAADRGSPTSERNWGLEQRITTVRWLGVGLCAIAAPFLGLGGHLLTVYLCLAVTGLYNLAFSRLVTVGRPHWLLQLYAYGTFDIIVATVIIGLTGGPSSPFALAYFPIIVHAAVRFGRKVAVFSSAVTAVGYFGAVLLGSSDAPQYSTILLAIGFVALTATFAGLLSDRAHEAELALAQQLDQARALNDAGSVLTASLDWSVVVQQITEQGRALARADAAILALRSSEPHKGGVDRFNADERVTHASPTGAYIAKLVLQSNLLTELPAPMDGAVEAHELGTQALLGDEARQLPSASLLRAPMLVQHRWVGDLLLLRATQREPFTEADAEIIRAFASRAALTLENAWLYGRAKEQASTDPVTSLPNHRSLKERLDQELARAQRQGQDLCVLMLDIDHFKAYNDSFGHAAGDSALQAVSETLRRSLRRMDYAARYAGEEFVIILPETNAQTGAVLAERLRIAVAGLVESEEFRLLRPLTVSIGSASYPHDADDRDMLLQAADLAMYLAKHGGRNQVCMATELETVRGLEALFAQFLNHAMLPNTRWGPHMVSDLERRFARVATLQTGGNEDVPDDGPRRLHQYTIQAVTALATTIDAKDPYTDGHSRRVSALGVLLARALRRPAEEVETVRVAGLLHDIGKIAISEATLHKPGPLSDDEWRQMRSHPDIGLRILTPIAALRSVFPLVRHHHERWDGEGYPLRLAGEQIPLGARIIAICDAYDTMVSDRPYRPALGHECALARLYTSAGTQFDPRLVEAFSKLPLLAASPVVAAAS